MAITYTVGTLLIEDTFTRSGALGSTESGSLGSLAWIGDTAKLPCNGSEAVAVNPANAVGVVGSVYVNVPAGMSVRVDTDDEGAVTVTDATAEVTEAVRSNAERSQYLAELIRQAHANGTHVLIGADWNYEPFLDISLTTMDGPERNADGSGSFRLEVAEEVQGVDHP